MDPLSITASIVSITTAALQSVRLLVKTIDDIKDAPETVKGVSDDLRAVQPVLQNLDKALYDSPSQIILGSQVKYAVENCDRACVTFKSQMERWMEHSTGDKMFWIDRWKIGLFGLQRIKTFKGLLSDSKGTLSVALSTATMYLSSVSANQYAFF